MMKYGCQRPNGIDATVTKIWDSWMFITKISVGQSGARWRSSLIIPISLFFCSRYIYASYGGYTNHLLGINKKSPVWKPFLLDS